LVGCAREDPAMEEKRELWGVEKGSVGRKTKPVTIRIFQTDMGPQTKGKAGREEKERTGSIKPSPRQEICLKPAAERRLDSRR